MRASGYALTAALLVAAPSAQSREFDNSTITCAAFLGSGEANMAALISWLRGYHAGKTGIIPFESPALTARGSAPIVDSIPAHT
jgi:hypothetical protein